MMMVHVENPWRPPFPMMMVHVENPWRVGAINRLFSRLARPRRGIWVISAAQSGALGDFTLSGGIEDTAEMARDGAVTQVFNGELGFMRRQAAHFLGW